MYDVTIDPARQMLKVRVHGFWTEAVMAGYLDDLRAKSSMLRQAGGCSRILIDMSDYPIQSTAIAEGHAAALRFARERMGARAAIVMTSALSRLQASRVASSTGHRIFDREGAAIEWLLGDGD